MSTMTAWMQGWGDLRDLFKFSTPVDLGAALVGGLIAIAVVFATDWARQPVVSHLGFTRRALPIGTFYYLRFELRGLRGLAKFSLIDPGIGTVEIGWRGHAVPGKWDELPEPGYYTGPGVLQFQPSLVPSTFYQALFYRPYEVPILLDPSPGVLPPHVSLTADEVHIYSGWWYGWPQGYGSDPTVNDGDTITLTVRAGAGVQWSESFAVSDIRRSANSDSPTPAVAPW